ncbi:MAG: hypothetical protein FJ029_07175 [Actinobacteria bacterium]|nr:hypothetical protein [Actinomycetota bacterium]
MVVRLSDSAGGVPATVEIKAGHGLAVVPMGRLRPGMATTVRAEADGLGSASVTLGGARAAPVQARGARELPSVTIGGLSISVVWLFAFVAIALPGALGLWVRGRWRQRA